MMLVSKEGYNITYRKCKKKSPCNFLIENARGNAKEKCTVTAIEFLLYQNLVYLISAHSI
ncbi:hypothetical protein GCWU000282_02998 [Catonella morbi ATCC 51271]|uniref:Uncharacterized protein n=1 Tax=Catonella morbi ATCC 51271 TaxID=592026 RepID=V2XI83_9FIRM|nr:hypothetical protein GCWU000282_02998 [Catonella morbi ATCC 51271]